MDVSLYSLHSVPGAVLGTGPHGYHVDWAAVQKHVRDHPDQLLGTTHGHLAREWTLSLAKAWGTHFRVYPSARFLIVSSRPEKVARNLVRLGERASAWMHDTLPAIASHWGYTKQVCLVADTQDRYYDYVSQFYQDGKFGASGGVFVTTSGYAHFVINHAEPWSQELAFVHELAHALLLCAELPIWLEEGLTQAVEATFLGHHHEAVDRAEAARHRSFWVGDGLASYWTGASFHRSDEGQELSYALSRALLRNLTSRGHARFLDFLREARKEDCGAAACLAVYGFTLSDLAGQFLGPGHWSPLEPPLEPRASCRALFD